MCMVSFFISRLSFLVLVICVFYFLFLLLWSVLLNIYPLHWSLQISVLVICLLQFYFQIYWFSTCNYCILSFAFFGFFCSFFFFFGFSKSKRKVSLFIWDSSWNQWWAKEVIKILWACFPEFSLFFDLCGNFWFPMVTFFVLPVIKMDLL